MKAYINTAANFCADHIKELIGYGGIGIVWYKMWGDVILPIIIAAVCAAVGATIQHFVKRYWNRREQNARRYSQNGKK